MKGENKMTKKTTTTTKKEGFEIKNPTSPMTYGQATKIAMIFYKDSGMTIEQASKFIDKLESQYRN